MSGMDNYNGSFGNQMNVSVNTGAGAAPAPAGGHVKDTTTANFAKDVLEESRRQPVLVDFWAPWCGPCKQLAPIIEKVVNESAGRVKLVKLNIDDHPAIPGQLGIQSIPAVIAFVNGRPADGFMGAVPETQIRQFIDRIAGPAADDPAAQIAAILEEADAALAAGDTEGAGEMYSAVLQADPENARAIAGIAECLLAANRHEDVRQFLSTLPENLLADAAVQPVVKKLEQVEEARKLGDPVALEHELALNPDHHEARLKLAKIRNVEGKRDEAVDHLIHIMKQDRAFDDDGARRQLLAFFDVWGFKDPATVAGRRKLSAILFS